MSDTVEVQSLVVVDMCTANPSVLDTAVVETYTVAVHSYTVVSVVAYTVVSVVDTEAFVVDTVVSNIVVVESSADTAVALLQDTEGLESSMDTEDLEVSVVADTVVELYTVASAVVVDTVVVESYIVASVVAVDTVVVETYTAASVVDTVVVESSADTAVVLSPDTEVVSLAQDT